jgi:hypothetical protein
MRKLEAMFAGMMVSDLSAEQIMAFCGANWESKKGEGRGAKGAGRPAKSGVAGGLIKMKHEGETKAMQDAAGADKPGGPVKSGTAGGVALKTHNNRRNLVSPFLTFAEEKGWLVKNPIAKVPFYKIAHQRGSAETISAMQATELMAFLQGYKSGRLVTHFALCLFAGIRPDINNGEISKLRAMDVNLATRTILVEPEVSKVDMKRNVTIQPNLAVWLTAYPLERYPIIVPSIGTHRTFIAQKFGLGHDVLRHTFISMHVAKFRSLGDTALQAGNSERIIRKHYLDVKSPEEAEAFWNVLPKVTR